MIIFAFICLLKSNTNIDSTNIPSTSTLNPLESPFSQINSLFSNHNIPGPSNLPGKYNNTTNLNEQFPMNLTTIKETNPCTINCLPETCSIKSNNPEKIQMDETPKNIKTYLMHSKPATNLEDTNEIEKKESILKFLKENTDTINKNLINMDKKINEEPLKPNMIFSEAKHLTEISLKKLEEDFQDLLFKMKGPADENKNERMDAEIFDFDQSGDPIFRDSQSKSNENKYNEQILENKKTQQAIEKRKEAAKTFKKEVIHNARIKSNLLNSPVLINEPKYTDMKRIDPKNIFVTSEGFEGGISNVIPTNAIHHDFQEHEILSKSPNKNAGSIFENPYKQDDMNLLENSFGSNLLPPLNIQGFESNKLEPIFDPAHTENELLKPSPPDFFSKLEFDDWNKTDNTYRKDFNTEETENYRNKMREISNLEMNESMKAENILERTSPVFSRMNETIHSLIDKNHENEAEISNLKKLDVIKSTEDQISTLLSLSKHYTDLAHPLIANKDTESIKNARRSAVYAIGFELRANILSNNMEMNNLLQEYAVKSALFIEKSNMTLLEMHNADIINKNRLKLTADRSRKVAEGFADLYQEIRNIETENSNNSGNNNMDGIDDGLLEAENFLENKKIGNYSQRPDYESGPLNNEMRAESENSSILSIKDDPNTFDNDERDVLNRKAEELNNQQEHDMLENSIRDQSIYEEGARDQQIYNESVINEQPSILVPERFISNREWNAPDIIDNSPIISEEVSEIVEHKPDNIRRKRSGVSEHIFRSSKVLEPVIQGTGYTSFIVNR